LWWRRSARARMDADGFGATTLGAPAIGPEGRLGVERAGRELGDRIRVRKRRHRRDEPQVTAAEVRGREHLPAREAGVERDGRAARPDHVAVEGGAPSRHTASWVQTPALHGAPHPPDHAATLAVTV
jgi:hypothetical protein